MRSGFERFGIKALSPSMLNAFSQNPAHWAVRYLLRVKDNMSPAAFRGTAVEFGLSSYLHAQDRPNAIEIATNEALRSFETNCGQNGVDITGEEAQSELELIPKMLTQALTVYMGRPRPIAYQLKVEDWVDEADMPMIGYIDFVFPDSVDDLKTTKALPSKPSLPHLRQLSLYSRARKEKPVLTYVTAKKAVSFPLAYPDLHDAWDGMTRDAVAIGNLLSKAETPLEVVRMLPINQTDYVWGDAQLQAALSAQTYLALPNKGNGHALAPAQI